MAKERKIQRRLQKELQSEIQSGFPDYYSDSQFYKSLFPKPLENNSPHPVDKGGLLAAVLSIKTIESIDQVDNVLVYFDPSCWKKSNYEQMLRYVKGLEEFIQQSRELPSKCSREGEVWITWRPTLVSKQYIPERHLPGRKSTSETFISTTQRDQRLTKEIASLTEGRSILLRG